MPEPLTILLVVVGIAVLWIAFKVVLNMAAALFRVGCFILFIIAVGVGIWYFFL